MASKVIVKLPVAPFGQVNKTKSGNVNGEIIVPRPQDPPPRTSDISKGHDGSRVAQLEQNIRFLQEQHQLMLSGLHNEIESLKNRNREIQFQLVFVKGTLPSSGSPSSPEDDIKHKIYSSPKTSLNITSLQVEMLEKELGELKLQTQETESRNVYLAAIVDEQKKKLERYERDREKERERQGQPDPELLRKLDDAEAIIRRLRRENSDLRREQYQPRETTHTNGRDNYTPSRTGRGGGNGRHRSNNAGHYRGSNWFAPLHTYWQAGGRPGDRNNLPVEGAGILPNVQAGAEAMSQQPQLGHYHGRRGSGNNNHYHNGEGNGRKYRGGQKNGKAT